MEPTHPDRLVENVTAPSAGGFPGPDGEVRLRMRLPFRTGSISRISWQPKVRAPWAIHSFNAADQLGRAAGAE